MVYSCEVCSSQFHLPILADADILACCPECGSTKIRLSLFHQKNKPVERERHLAVAQLYNCA